MKKNKYSLPVLISIIIFIVISLYAIFVNPDFEGKKSTFSFNDPETNITFDYSKDMVVSKTSYDDKGFIEIMPKNLEGQFDTQIIEIAYQESDLSKSLREEAKDYLKLNTDNKLNNIGRKDAEVLQYISSIGAGEKNNFSFLRSNDKTVIVIFYQRHFQKDNPLRIVDNSQYLRSYFQIINSIKTDRALDE